MFLIELIKTGMENIRTNADNAHKYKYMNNNVVYGRLLLNLIYNLKNENSFVEKKYLQISKYSGCSRIFRIDKLMVGINFQYYN